MGCQLVGEYPPLVVELFKAFGNGIFYSRDEVHLTICLLYTSTEITLHKAAKAAFDEANLKTLPKVKALAEEYSLSLIHI